jgi:hypothetical protein
MLLWPSLNLYRLIDLWDLIGCGIKIGAHEIKTITIFKHHINVRSSMPTEQWTLRMYYVRDFLPLIAPTAIEI